MRMLLAAVTTTLLAGSARADSPREHDGLYVRAGAGPGYATGGARSSQSDVTASLTGVAISTELAVGTTIGRGLVVGGGVYPGIIPSPRFRVGDGPSGPGGGYHVSALGPFVDFYFDPKGETHVQGALLFSAGYIEGTAGGESATGFGLGGMLGVGYEFWVSDKLSVGPLLRATYYRLWASSSDTSKASSHNLFVPSLLLAVTYQ